MKYRSTIRTDVETGLTAHAPFFICHNCTGFRDASPSTSRTDIHAGRLFAVLTDDWHEDRNLFPFPYPYSRKSRAAGALMRKAADHFTGLTSSTAFWDDRDGAHWNNLLISFFIENISLYK
jgi:hypothetical protein